MKYGAVASGHKYTSETAMLVLRNGGNAIDAAVASYLTACVAEPCMASLAAGAFIMIYHEGRILSLDAFCQTPLVRQSNSQLIPIDVDFGNTQETYFGGAGAMAVPGVVKGLFALHHRYGSMPMSELVQPAAQLAREGIVLNGFQQYDLSLLQSIFSLEERGQSLFFNDGVLKEIGEKVALPHLEDFLFVLGKEGERFFYHGEFSKKVEDYSKLNHGHLRRIDFENYEVQWLTPAHAQFYGFDIFQPSAPSMGHAIFKAILKSSNQSIEPERIYSGDHLMSLLAGLQANRELLDDRPGLFNAAGIQVHAGGKLSGTSHLNVIDNMGHGVTMTFSIGEGSGVFIEGTDVHMNNMLGEPALLPDGLDSWYADQRLASMMTPTIVTKGEALTCLLGTGGAERIPAMLYQTLDYLLDKNLPIEKAIESPRAYRSEHFVEAELGFENVQIDNVPINHWDKKSLYFGGVHAIHCTNATAVAFSDDRREGYALVE